MVLHADSDAAYLTITEACSWYTRYIYLSHWHLPQPAKPSTKRNSYIHTNCNTICDVVSSLSEYETCRTQNNGKTAIDMQIALIALYHNQPETTLKTENSTTEGFFNLGMKTKRSKTWDMKWHWLRDKEVLNKLILYWYKVKNKDTNYLKNIILQFITVKFDLDIYIIQIQGGQLLKS